MNFYQLPEYKNLEKEINKNFRLKINSLLITIVGYSAKYFVKKYIERNPKKVNYIFKPDQKLGKYNILDVDFSENERALDIIESYIKQADLKQKFMVVINTPHILDVKEFKRSYIGAHYYSKYLFKKPGFDYIKNYSKEMGVKLNNNSLRHLYKLTGGIGRLTKYLLVNSNLITLRGKELIDLEDIKNLIEPIVREASKCSKATLKLLGVYEKDNFSSSIINEHFLRNGIPLPLEIEITPDLYLFEKKNRVCRINKVESEILKHILENNGIIEKEKIADIKWGEGSYDKYSDQAIVKTIRRLNKKIIYYNFKTISGVGYKLIENV